MLEHRGSGQAFGRGLILSILAWILLACTAGSGPAGTAASPAVVASATAAAVASPSASSEPASAPPESASPSASASTAPVLNPEHCPTTLPSDLYRTADGTQIDGDDAFIGHVEKALALLEEQAQDAYADVLVNVSTIWQVESFSGMCYDTGTYRVGEQTAYAPGHPVERQLVWLAGTIVHDGCHRARYVAGLEPSGRDAELACLELQVKALAKLKDTFLTDYVQNLIDTVDDPDSQYWTDPNRHW